MNSFLRQFFLLFSFILFILSNALSQTSVFDSLKRELINIDDDIKKIEILNELAFEYKNVDLSLANSYAQKAIEISEKINYTKGLAYGLYNLGTYYWRSGQYDTTLVICERALILFEKLNDADGRILTHNRIGITNLFRGGFREATNHYFKALEISEETGSITYIGMVYHNIGSIYSDLNDHIKSLEYIEKAIEHKKGFNDPISMGVSLSKRAKIYLELDSLDKALIYSKESLKHNLPIQNNFSICTAYQALASTFDAMGQFDSAYVNHQNSLHYANKYGNKRQKCISNVYLAKHYLMLKQYDDALKYASLSLTIANENDYENHQIYAKQVISNVYVGLGKYEDAILLLKELNDQKANLFKFDHMKRLAVEEKELEFKIRQHAIQFKQKAKLEREKTVRNYIIGALVFVLVVLALILFILRQKTLANYFLKEANETRDKMFKLISHDFRSPLISISNTMQLIPIYIENGNSEKAIDLSKKNEKSVSKVLQLIDSLINWTLSQNNTIPYHPMRFNLAEITQMVFDVYATVAHSKKIVLINSIPSDIYIEADQDILNTVLRNLINNSIKYTSENGKVTVNAKKENEEIILCVADNGIGIESGKLKSIFFAGKNKRIGTDGEKGSGLGLFFSKEFVEKNKGRIWIESLEGIGTKVFFTVPSA